MDRWSRRKGHWAIDHRQFIPESYTRIEFTNAFAGDSYMSKGRRDKSDPYYIACAELDAR